MNKKQFQHLLSMIIAKPIGPAEFHEANLQQSVDNIEAMITILNEQLLRYVFVGGTDEKATIVIDTDCIYKLTPEELELIIHKFKNAGWHDVTATSPDSDTIHWVFTE